MRIIRISGRRFYHTAGLVVNTPFGIYAKRLALVYNSKHE